MTTGDNILRSEATRTMRIACACTLDAVRAASLRVREFLLEQGLNEEELGALELALVEAGNNAVEHTSPSALGEEIQIEAEASAQEIEVRVYDRTPGFDWPELSELPGDESESGRGIFLIQSLTDRSNYLRSPRGNCLIFAKSRMASQGPPALAGADLSAKVQDLELTLEGMTDELGCSYETLTSIFRYSAEIASTQNVGDFADRLVRDLAEIAEADAVVLRLYDAEKKELNIFRTMPPGAAESLSSLPMPSAMESVEVWSATARNDVWFDAGHPLSSADPLRPLGEQRIGVCHPFALNDQLFGTITIARAATEVPFRAAQVNVLHTLADFLAIQIANERFLQERTQSQIMRRELDIAASIQKSLLPTRNPNAAPFSIASCCESARDVGGDFFDILPVGNDGLLFLVADVMGKGIPAALFAAILRSVVHSLPQNFDNPAQLLSAVNRILYDDFSRVDMFATALVAYLDTRGRRLLAASAGHCPLLIAQVGEAKLQTIGASGPPLGVIPEIGYFSESVTLRRGARVLLYTDGITETANPQGEMFTEARLVDWFGQRRLSGRSAPALKSQLLEELTRFQNGQVPRDDQTFILIAEDSI